jgi:hypothetical protein
MFKYLLTIFLTTSALAQTQNLNDAKDANQVPANQEGRVNQRINQPDNRDNDYVPASKEARQRQEVEGPLNDRVEEEFGLDSRDRYSDDDKYGTPDTRVD